MADGFIGQPSAYTGGEKEGNFGWSKIKKLLGNTSVTASVGPVNITHDPQRNRMRNQREQSNELALEQQRQQKEKDNIEKNRLNEPWDYRLQGVYANPLITQKQKDFYAQTMTRNGIDPTKATTADREKMKKLTLDNPTWTKQFTQVGLEETRQEAIKTRDQLAKLYQNPADPDGKNAELIKAKKDELQQKIQHIKGMGGSAEKLIKTAEQMEKQSKTEEIRKTQLEVEKYITANPDMSPEDKAKYRLNSGTYKNDSVKLRLQLDQKAKEVQKALDIYRGKKEIDTEFPAKEVRKTNAQVFAEAKEQEWLEKPENKGETFPGKLRADAVIEGIRKQSGTINDENAIRMLNQAMKEAMPEAQKSDAALSEVKVLEDLLAKGGVTGKEGQFKSAIAGWVQLFHGADVEGLSNAQAFQKIARIMTGPLRLDLIGGGQITEMEQKLWTELSGAGGMSEGAVKRLVNIYKDKLNNKVNYYERMREGLSTQSDIYSTIYPSFKTNKKTGGSKPPLVIR